MDESVRRLVRLHREVSVVDDAEKPGGTVLRRPRSSGQLGALSPGVRAVLRRLEREHVSESELVGEVVELDGQRGAFGWQLMVRKLARSGLLEHSVECGGRIVATLRPLGAGPVTEGKAPDPDSRVKLSRFATTRAAEGALLVETPLSHLGVELSSEVAPLLAVLARESVTVELAGRAALDAELVTAVLGMFSAAGLLVNCDEGDREVREQGLAQWSVVDLWQHRRSRSTGPAERYGATYPLKGLFDPLPAVPPSSGARRVELEPVAPEPGDPETGHSETGDSGTGDSKSDVDSMTLSEALRKRSSTRSYDAESPLRLEELGELLYRSVHTKATFPVDGDEGSVRPYPSGGALHELEVYPVITSCAGVDPGVWHYASADHALEFVAEFDDAARNVVEQARAAAMMESPPQVLLVVAARFGRVLWKYEGMGYALMLKHVGVLYQTLYLVSTAMGIGGCALGGGNADAFARATGCSPFELGSVGEFVVGAPATGRR